MYQLIALIITAFVLALSFVAVFKTIIDPTVVRRRGYRFGFKNAAVSTQGTTIEVSIDGGTTFVPISQITDVPDPSGEAADLDATNLDSTAKEYIAGLLDTQAINITGQRVATDPGQNILRDNAGAVTPAMFKITFSDGAVSAFNALIKKFGTSGNVDAILMFTCAIRATGAQTWSGTGAPT